MAIDNRIKKEQLRDSVFDFLKAPLDITYANLVLKIAANSLIPGTYYRIIDYQTKHQISGTTEIHIGPIEPLSIRANTVNVLDSAAFSSIYPRDIIYYNLNDDVCEDGTTSRTGKIIYRKDPIVNIEIYYDWRNVIFRRWKLKPVAYDNLKTYPRSEAVLGSDGSIYISKRASNTGNDPINSSYYDPNNSWFNEYANTNSIWWEKIVLANKNQYLAYQPDTQQIASANIPVDANDFTDWYTFNTNGVKGDYGLANNIKIGFTPGYNNIIFINDALDWGGAPDNNYYTLNNEFEIGCYNCTIQGWFILNNKFGMGSGNIIIQGVFYNNETGSGFANSIAAYCDFMSLGGTSDNKIGGGFSGHVLNGQFRYNTVLEGSYIANGFFGVSFERNYIQGHFYNNSFNKDSQDNVFQFVNSCNFGDTFSQNVVYGGGDGTSGLRATIFGNGCKSNFIMGVSNSTVGNLFRYNSIKNCIFNNLNIPDNFQYNKINGTIAAGTYFAIGTSQNTFNNTFSGGTQAAPLSLISCVFNQPVSGLTTNAGITLTRVVFNSAITNKNITSNQSDSTVNASPDGALWALTIQSNTGSLTTTLIS